jgi:tetratricopeptide (TPR) repeat protein
MPKDANAVWKLGDDCYKAGRYAEAVEHFREYIWANPNDPAGHHSLGLAYCQLGEFAQAIDPFLRALRLGTEFAEVYHTLGTVYSELEQHDNAANAFQNAVRLEPDNADNHCSLATSYLMLNKPTEAMHSAKEALRLNPNSADAYLHLGCALHYDSGTFAEAAAAYQKALQLQADQFIALGNLGAVSLQMGRLEEAQDALIRAVNINPNDSKLHALLGQVYLRLNKQDKALSELEILKRLDPSKARELSKSLNQTPD